MSRSPYNWMVVYADGNTLVKTGRDVEDLYYNIDSANEVVAIIRMELA